MDFKEVYFMLVHASLWFVSQQNIEPCIRWRIEGNRCRPNNECRLIKIDCTRRTCETQPTCAPVQNIVNNNCRNGLPVLNMKDYTPIDCSAGGSTCPRDTICTSSAQGGPSRCCWDRQIIEPPPPPPNPIEPCTKWQLEGSRCRPNNECRLIKIDCPRPICETQPTCAPIQSIGENICRVGRPVLNMRNYTPINCSDGCPRGTTCTGSVLGRQTRCCWGQQDVVPPLPVFNPCSVRFCGSGKTCIVQTHPVCNSPPCQRIAVCVDSTQQNPCASTLCIEGNICVVRPDVNCTFASCKRIGVCVDPATEPTIDLCAKKICRSDEVCREETRFCPAVVGFPCPPKVAVCLKIVKPGVCPLKLDRRACLTAECKIDADCEANLKCCAPCRRCKPPIDPKLSQPIDLCAFKICRRDEVCREETRACIALAGVVCPPKIAVCRKRVKRGMCPRIHDRRACLPAECKIDGDCEANRKCCGPCRRCTPPITPSPGQDKPGTCPQIRNRAACFPRPPCRTDSDCQGKLKCCGCGICIRPIPPFPGQGVCPILTKAPCDMGCDVDSDCKRNEKCCKHKCGALCTNPVLTPGPGPDLDPCTTKICPFGFECRHLRHTSCNRPPCRSVAVCVVSDKGGVCPVVTVTVTVTGPCDNKCQEDSDCEPNLKCCKHGCVAVCTTPEDRCATINCPPGQECRLQQVWCFRAPCPPVPTCFDIVRPGVCPRFPDVGGPFCTLDVNCNADSDCSSGLKCCSTGRCGPKCLVPEPFPV